MKLNEEQIMENISYTLDQALDFVLADDSAFEELDSDYEYDVLKKNKNKNNGDQSGPD